MTIACKSNILASVLFVITICFILQLVIFNIIMKHVKLKQLDIYSSQSEMSVFDIDLDITKVFKILRHQRNLIEELACSYLGVGARGGYCLNAAHTDFGGNTLWDHKLALNLESLFENKTVGDFGAGLGWYGRFWLRETTAIWTGYNDVEKWAFLDKNAVRRIHGKLQRIKSWEGFDGAGNVERITNHWVRFLDLTEEHDLPHKYDWVFSLEVGEHIPPAFEKVFVENLVRHACKGIVISWAVEGQVGYFHVNSHNNSYVKDLFYEYGFISNEYWERRLRRKISLKYLRNTVMVFDRVPPLNHKKCLKQNN